MKMTYLAVMVSSRIGKGEQFGIERNQEKGALMRGKIGIIIGSMLVLCILSGCKKPPKEEITPPTPTSVLNLTMTPLPTDTPLTVAPSGSTELPIYTINGDFTELTAVTALIGEGEEITEQVVCEAVIDALADNAIYVTVNEITKNGTVVIVDFEATSPPVSQVGASIEGLILDAFGQSLLDNVEGCNGVSFSVDGGDYASGHFEFSKDEIYLRR